MLTILGLVCWGFLFTRVKNRIKKYGRANIPYAKRGGGGDDEEQPQARYTQSPEYQRQMELFQNIQEPYIRSQYEQYEKLFKPLTGQLGEKITKGLTIPYQSPLYTNVFEPQARTLGNILGVNLTTGANIPTFE